MFDIGWSELLLIGIVALIVVGPKELPGLFRTVGRYMGKARGMAREFQRSMEQAADDTGLKEAASGLKSLDRLNLHSATTAARKHAASAITDPKTPAKTPASTATPATSEPAVAGPSAASEPAAAEPAAAPDPRPAAAEKTDGAAGP
jgi:sec-independent protein translocase protein TatB